MREILKKQAPKVQEETEFDRFIRHMQPIIESQKDENEDNLYVLLSFSLPYIKSEKNLVDFYKTTKKQ